MSRMRDFRWPEQPLGGPKMMLPHSFNIRKIAAIVVLLIAVSGVLHYFFGSPPLPPVLDAMTQSAFEVRRMLEEASALAAAKGRPVAVLFPQGLKTQLPSARYLGMSCAVCLVDDKLAFDGWPNGSCRWLLLRSANVFSLVAADGDASKVDLARDFGDQFSAVDGVPAVVFRPGVPRKDGEVVRIGQGFATGEGPLGLSVTGWRRVSVVSAGGRLKIVHNIDDGK